MLQIWWFKNVGPLPTGGGGGWGGGVVVGENAGDEDGYTSFGGGGWDG